VISTPKACWQLCHHNSFNFDQKVKKAKLSKTKRNERKMEKTGFSRFRRLNLRGRVLFFGSFHFFVTKPLKAPKKMRSRFEKRLFTRIFNDSLTI
jgi:hypothetical protein